MPSSEDWAEGKFKPTANDTKTSTELAHLSVVVIPPLALSASRIQRTGLAISSKIENLPMRTKKHESVF
jgi:hypothetical protein